MTGQAGGWPLTVFLTPDQIPIFTGTYFPKERRYGMPAFREVLVAIDEYYRGKGDEIRERGASLVEALGSMQTASADDFAALSRAPLVDGARAREADLRRRARRLRRRAEVPAYDDARAPARAWARAPSRRRGQPSAGDGHAVARLHGAARPLRSPGRRVLPLQRRPVLVDSALREDALRQRAAARPLRRRVRGDGHAALCERRERHGRLGHARHAGRARRLLLDARRRLRARGRQVLRLDAGRSSTPCSGPKSPRSRSASSA